MTEWDKYLANGIPKTQGPVSQRKEIRDLNPVEMYLFLEGLAKFQQVSMDDSLSYFRIAGIHGLPYEAWPIGNDEIAQGKSFVQGGEGGFCTHSSILFLTWHRPYLALFESQLYKHVNDIAAGIDVSQAGPYVEAAKAFRLPYWDWARRKPESVFPRQALSSNTNYRKGHPASSASVAHSHTPNPLEKFLFEAKVDPNISLSNLQSQQNSATTLRYPESATPVEDLLNSVQSFYSQVDNVSQTRNLSERVSYLLKSYQRYGPMSSNAFAGGGPTASAEIFGSLEDIHNSVHGLTGGEGGHMSNVANAAYDPIFWLHHANIDRLFAIWQVLHQDKSRLDSWVPREEVQWPNYYASAGEFQDRSSLLYPFRKSANDENPWYTSDDTIWTEDFGYAYPETAGFKPQEASSDNILTLERTVEALYQSPVHQIRRSIQKDPRAGEFLLPQAAVLQAIQTTKVPPTVEETQKVVAALPDPPALLEQSLEPSKPLLRQLAPDGHYLEWLVNIKAVKHSLGGKYTVHIFLGDVREERVELWPFSPSFVGTFYPFGQSANTRCAKCQDDQSAQLQVTSQIPLTLALMERYLAGIVPDLTPQSVTPYLTKNLHWRVTLDGRVLADRSQVEGLTVFVVSNKVTLPENASQQPIYDPDVTVYPEITTNQQDTGRGEGTGLAVGQA